MPMIDVHAPAGLLPTATHAALAEALTHAVLRAEGAPVAEPWASNTAAWVHELPATAVHTAAAPEAAVVRVSVTTPPGALDREGQRRLVADATAAVAEAAGDPEQAARTWVVLREAAEGGWGVAGHALGREEFAAMAAAARQAA